MSLRAGCMGMKENGKRVQVEEVVRENGVVGERVGRRGRKIGGIYRYGSGSIHAWKMER